MGEETGFKGNSICKETPQLRVKTKTCEACEKTDVLLWALPRQICQFCQSWMCIYVHKLLK